MKVKKWISYSESTGHEEAPCGGLGGFFDNGMRWKDYIECWKPISLPYIEALRKSIIERGLKITGADHQRDPDVVPVFSDNTVATYSYRAWGDLMAAIWSEEENADYCYMDFYM